MSEPSQCDTKTFQSATEHTENRHDRIVPAAVSAAAIAVVKGI